MIDVIEGYEVMLRQILLPTPPALNSNASNGWTLIEISTVAVVAGILASFAMPSLMNLKARIDLRGQLSNIKQSLQQAQRNAIKMGKECKVEMDTASNPPTIRVSPGADYVGCLPFSELALNDMKLYENVNGNKIRFSYKGNSWNLGTLVLTSSKTDARYCLVISNGIGMMRTGNYIKDPEDSVDGDYCEAMI